MGSLTGQHAVVTGAGRGIGANGVDEDPVSGVSHCTLVPYWAGRLGRDRLTGRQLSARGGTLVCRAKGERVEISGRCVLVLEGWLMVP